MSIGGRKQDLHLDAEETRDIVFTMPPGVRYEKEVQALAWVATVRSSSGFTPIFFDPNSTDSRYLGVRVRPVLEARP